MSVARRSFLQILPGVASVFGVGCLLAQTQGLPRPFPEAQGPEHEPPIKPDSRAILKNNQKDIKRDVERLAELAGDLKKQVEKTDSSEVLSLPLVRKAEEIEKLARHIRSLALG